jgi:hypothetical protein
MTRAAHCPVCAAPDLSGGRFTADTDEELFAMIADHTIKVHGGGPADAFSTAEDALPWVGAAYRRDAAARPHAYQPQEPG